MNKELLNLINAKYVNVEKILAITGGQCLFLYFPFLDSGTDTRDGAKI